MSLKLPRFEMHEEGSQIRRSAKSVSSNIVEGYVLRKYKNEFLHYLYRSYGSVEETLEHLHYLYGTKSLTDQQLYDELVDSYWRLNGMLFRFIETVEHQHGTPMILKDIEEEYLPDLGSLNPES
jgi:four helix bundle protein